MSAPKKNDKRGESYSIREIIIKWDHCEIIYSLRV